MRRLPPLNSVKAFEAVVRLGTYNNAAEELGVTHGAISRQVRVLERYFGCRLFQAAGRHLVPTELARYYAAETGAGLDRIASATARVIEPAAARLVRVSGTPSFAMHWLVPRLAEFQRQHSSTEVSIAASREPLDHLVSSNDIILRRKPMEWDGFECRAIFSDYRVLVGSPELLMRRPVCEAKDVLAGSLLISDGKNQAGVWERWIQAEGLEPRRNMKRVKFDHIFVLMEAATKGLGLALLPFSLTASFIEAGTLVEPLPHVKMPYPNMYALYPELSRRPSSVKAFVNWLIEQGEGFSGKFEHPNPFSASVERQAAMAH
ncbi:LysR substrate-binding domain-containing protein [Corticibacterium sp. UT-5YL-CI-8]|nr:LysR substrate-binding domain-containing protein [Tianweitania sp. UT-5YL-CI-8]